MEKNLHRLVLALYLLNAWGGASASLVPALFVFGDSTLDTGNLNYRPNTVHLIRTQELPYGRDFIPPGPTGRASNGKLATDFLAGFLGLPTPIDDLEPDAQGRKLFQGINFAAGGSGILNGTGLTTVSLSQQLDAFEGSIASINKLMGSQESSRLLANSLFLLSTGNNDLFNYVYNPKARFRYSPESYNTLLLSTLSRDLERLYSLGARKLVVLSLGPLGCTPLMLNLLNSDGSCIGEVNDQAKNFNAGLQSLLAGLQTKLPGSRLLYANAYDILFSAIQDPRKHAGFRYGNVACCGSGKFLGSVLQTCSGRTSVCADSNEYVFWDMVHPTQAMYKLVTDELYAELVKFIL
ncbi:hypothetical protein SELMODRAFT_77440 [Selaginella moellendorffii]|uniref:Uncharacterized protein n=1 Tax=Selaginella moellendorffii TaxID=88036 RepID=D8QRB5_SELML|nr:hypothetical protein SELMODRAFT_77440 [Selaginella moellendorffii]